jgi:hypothetical protein
MSMLLDYVLLHYIFIIILEYPSPTYKKKLL